MLKNKKVNTNDSDTNSTKSVLTYKIIDKYQMIKKIGSGSFGDVYLAQNIEDKEFIAAKVEYVNKPQRIKSEFDIYQYLVNCGFRHGIPKIYDLIETPEYNIMCMQLLGQSLEDVFNEHNRIFNLNTTFEIAIQILNLLEKLHKIGFIHRDIKPNNFLVDKETRSIIHIMDFGLSKKYRYNGKHMKFKEGRSLIGTARYASRTMHMGIEPTRRDDLESLGYMLIYFAKGKLPWQGLKKEKGFEGMNNITMIGNKKMSVILPDLCEGLPSCFAEYLKYCRSLKFDEDPDYQLMKNLFLRSSYDMNIRPVFEWTI